MSAEETLSERDQQILETIDDDLEAATDASEFEAIARDLRDRFAEHRAEFQAFKGDVEQRLQQLEDGNAGGAVDDDAPPIVHYANLSAEDRDAELSTSERIAVTLHEEWEDVAWKLGDAENRRMGVDTKTKANAKHNPSKLRHRLKAKLDRDFEAIEIYRGLKRLAKLSGGSEFTKDQGNRVEIIGGWYRYEERATPDAKGTVKVLWRDD